MARPVTLRAAEIENVITANPGLDLAELDLFDTGVVAMLDWAGLDPDTHIETLRGIQRLMRIGANTVTIEALLAEGYHSANQIARHPEGYFSKQVAAKLGIDRKTGRTLHRRAVGVRNKTHQLWATVNGAIAARHYRGTRFDNISTELAQTFEGLPSYQDLFGSLDYCSCQECKSIFGPAAYLVDLQRIIDEYVTMTNEATIPPDLTFDARRPDIAQIPLTCEATNTLFPYLSIVNKVLLDRALQELSLDDNDAVLEALATTLVYPRALPFNRPLSSIQVLLDCLGTSFAQLLAAWQTAPDTVAARDLGISPTSEGILTTVVTEADDIAPYYGMPASDLSTLRDPAVFLQVNGLNYAQLLELVNQDLTAAEVTAGLQANFFINSELDGIVVSIDDSGIKETIQNLEVPALDTINRLLRLADSLGWTLTQTDWALRCAAAGQTPIITRPALTAIATFKQAMTRFELGFYQAAALFGPIKTYGNGDEDVPDPFDALFNTPQLVVQAGLYHPDQNPLNPTYKDTPLSWKPQDEAPENVAAINRVLPGFGLSLTEMNALGAALFGVAAPVGLTVGTLSALYRHAVLKATFDLPMSEYLLLLKLCSASEAELTVSRLTELIGVQVWMSGTGTSVYDLDYVIAGVASVYVALPYDPGSVGEWQVSLIKQIPDPMGANAESQITDQVAALFGVQAATIVPVFGMALSATLLPTGVETWTEAFLTHKANGEPKYPDYCKTVLAWCARWLVLQETLSASPAVMQNIGSQPAAYDLKSDFSVIPLSAVQAIDSIVTTIASHGDMQNKLLTYITECAPGSATPEAQRLQSLYEATNWPASVTGPLLNGPLKSVSPLTAQIGSLAAAMFVINTTGANPTVLGSLAALADETAKSAWRGYLDASSATLAAAQSRYGIGWSDVATEIEGKLNVSLRDALLPLVQYELHKTYADIVSPRNVYEFLLIDVEMGPETQISVLKEALNASQLYLQRVRLRLEEGVDDIEIAPVWWSWMMNYRVWEANRQVFVYPENYLIPTLRKTTTPPFAELEDGLRQSKITDAYIDESFNTYVKNFFDAAQLRPVDTYRCKINNAVMGKVNATYVFARADTDPNKFYVCSQVDGMPWGAWSPIDVTINSETLTPVYAFDRLFVFWIEITPNSTSSIQPASSGGSQSTNSVSFKAAIRYSFLNAQGKWATTQTLLVENVVYFFSSGDDTVALADDKIFKGLFDVTKAAWTRPGALRVSIDNFPVQPKLQSKEKIAVFYGPFVINSGQPVDAGVAPTGGADALAFYDSLKSTVNVYNATISGQLSGNLPLRRAAVIDGLLDDSVLLFNKEFLLFDEYRPASGIKTVDAQLSSTDPSVVLASSPVPLSNLLVADLRATVIASADAATVGTQTFISTSINQATAAKIVNALTDSGVITASNLVDPDKLAQADLVKDLASVLESGVFCVEQVMDVQKSLFSALPAVTLFSDIDLVSSHVSSVRNQPGWYMLFAEGEVFLLSPEQSNKASNKAAPVFSTLDESTSVAVPLINEASFITTFIGEDTKTYSIDAKTSARIESTLVTYSIVKDGVIQLAIDFSTLQTFLETLSLTNEEIRVVYNTMYNAATVTDDVFTRRDLGIDAPLSKSLYQQFQAYSIIDRTGRVSRDVLTPNAVAQVLSNDIMNQRITPTEVPAIYAILVQAAKPVCLTYANAGDTNQFAGPGDYVFKVTRLSTSAVPKLNQALFAGSVDTLLSTSMQGYPVTPEMPFSRLDPSTTNIVWPKALDGTQVDFDGLYGEYFWELFFHIPRLISYMVQSSQDFETALTWLHYIFNPTISEEFVTVDLIVEQTNQAINNATAAKIITALQGHDIGLPTKPILDSVGRVNSVFEATTDLSFLGNAPTDLSAEQILMVQAILLNYVLSAPVAHYWQFFPFRNHTLKSLSATLSDDNPGILIYNDDPFDPFAIARLRIGAYEKATVMQYVDMLIRWGDMMFTQDSWESITAATMLYVYASDLLGPQPVEVGECPGSAPLTFADIKEAYAGDPHGIPQFLIDLEKFAPSGGEVGTSMMSHAFNDLNAYFCVPPNATLMGYWDTIDDRLYKIEHSMNIEGQVRTLALFQPPVNPLDLVKAAAADSNILSVASESATDVPAYRFTSSIAFARQIAQTVVSFGAALLASLEKQDAEGLSQLQTAQAGQILDMTTMSRQLRIDELNETIAGLNETLQAAQNRLAHYTNLIEVDISPTEETGLDAMTVGLLFNTLATVLETAAAIGYAVPQVGSPFAMTYGGQQLGNVTQASSGAAKVGAEISSFIVQRSQTMAGYERRKEDWMLQQQQAQYDIQQVTDSIAAAQKQLAQSEQELAINQRQIDQNAELVGYITEKFTNQKLYGWMASRLSTIYYQAYQVALDAAKRTQAALQFELNSDQTFVGFTYWDDQHKGLLAAEGLLSALDQMDAAYRSQNARRLEVMKTVSLGLVAPQALLDLKATGLCTFDLTEELFDYDYPGQYARKIKVITVSVPALLGPYEQIKATLTQTRNQVVTEPSKAVVEYLLTSKGTAPSKGLRTDWKNNQMVALSTGMDDSGLFTLNFADDRFLPYENTGAVSSWKLEMPKTTNRLNFENVSDVLVTIRYTALFDVALKIQVEKLLQKIPYSAGLYVDVSAQQPSAWMAFIEDHSDSSTQSLKLVIDPKQLGHFSSVRITSVLIKLDLGDGVTLSKAAQISTLTSGNQPSQPLSFTDGVAQLCSLNWDASQTVGDWSIAFDLESADTKPLLDKGFIDPVKMTDIEMVILYEGKVF